MSTSERGDAAQGTPGCNVSSTLNFTVGVLAIAAAVAIASGLWFWLR